MNSLKTRSLERIEDRMGSLDEGSIRYRLLASVKSFKTSWIDLGQALYSVWKDRIYKNWGYTTFDAYTSKELGIKKATAMKLLRSYYFLEKEEPAYLQKEQNESRQAFSIPGYESVNLLRLAKAKNALDKADYLHIRRSVLEMGREAGDVRKDLTTLMKQREELEPDEVRRQKRRAVIKRLVSSLKTLKTDIETSKFLPASMLKEIATLIHKIEAEI
jgi:hypothetical protein